jgi:hypothetical protein
LNSRFWRNPADNTNCLHPEPLVIHLMEFHQISPPTSL